MKYIALVFSMVIMLFAGMANAQYNQVPGAVGPVFCDEVASLSPPDCVVRSVRPIVQYVEVPVYQPVYRPVYVVPAPYYGGYYGRGYGGYYGGYGGYYGAGYYNGANISIGFGFGGHGHSNGHHRNRDH